MVIATGQTGHQLFVVQAGQHDRSDDLIKPGDTGRDVVGGAEVGVTTLAGRSLQVFYQIPFSMVQLIQAIIVICVASSDFFIRHRLRPVVSRGA